MTIVLSDAYLLSRPFANRTLLSSCARISPFSAAFTARIPRILRIACIRAFEEEGLTIERVEIIDRNKIERLAARIKC